MAKGTSRTTDAGLLIHAPPQTVVRCRADIVRHRGNDRHGTRIALTDKECTLTQRVFSPAHLRKQARREETRADDIVATASVLAFRLALGPGADTLPSAHNASLASDDLPRPTPA